MIGPQFHYPKNADGRIITTFEYIEQQAQAHPDKNAIFYHDEVITYQNLMRRVNGLAAQLAETGATQGDHVTVYNHRSLDYCIAVLAIFKLGAVYTPLDPLSKASTLNDVLSTFPKVRVIVGAGLNADYLRKIEKISSENLSVQLIKDEYWERDYFPTAIVGMQDLRYGIPTSGSTGKPKCALVHEQSMLLQQFVKAEETGLTENDVVAQPTTQLFDVHLWQIVTPLMRGASVVVLDRCEADAPSVLLDKIEKHGITVFQLVPSMFGILLDDFEKRPSLAKLKTLRWLAVTGEALPPRHCERWFDLFKADPPKIINMFGPTECGDDIGHVPIVDKYRYAGMEVLPIAREPIANSVFYLLNEAGELAKAGEDAILFVGGDCIGPGYLGMPEKTAEAFQMHEIDGRKIRLYNTGDFVRRLPSGEVVYKGRVANSYTKLAGQRVELMSFSHVVAGHPGVAQAVSVKAANMERVVTYVTLKPEYRADLTKRLQEERSKGIAEIFDGAVQAGGFSDEFNHGGWNNYLPGVSFSERAVKENLDDAKAHIAVHVNDQSDVLEVGCGSGMLAKDTAKKAKSYLGIDISAESVEIAKRACKDERNASFCVGDADKLSEKFGDRKFDVIFFNAVVNYFGSPEKLQEVLAQAKSLLKPKGKILVLDVYHVGCKPLLHAEFETRKLTHERDGRAKTIKLAKDRIEQASLRDPDLWLHPSFFADPNFSVYCHLKSGEADDKGLPNPMVRYRYGVVLDSAPAKKIETQITHLVFGKDIQSLAELFAKLLHEKPEVLQLSHVPNQRTHGSQALVNLIADSRDEDNLDGLRLQQISTSVDPMYLIGEAKARGYRVDNLLFSTDDVSKFDLVLTRSDIAARHYLAIEPSQRYPASNSPVRDQVFHLARTELEACSRDQHELGRYSTVLPIEQFPTIASGKVDTKALAARELPRIPEEVHWFEDVITEEEQKLKELILPFLQTSMSAATVIKKAMSFVELGLASIQLTSLLAKVNQQFNLELPLSVFGEADSLEKLAIYCQSIACANP